jgi:hypothetical protein
MHVDGTNLLSQSSAMGPNVLWTRHTSFNILDLCRLSDRAFLSEALTGVAERRSLYPSHRLAEHAASRHLVHDATRELGCPSTPSRPSTNTSPGNHIRFPFLKLKSITSAQHLHHTPSRLQFTKVPITQSTCLPQETPPVAPPVLTVSSNAVPPEQTVSSSAAPQEPIASSSAAPQERTAVCSKLPILRQLTMKNRGGKCPSIVIESFDKGDLIFF